MVEHRKVDKLKVENRKPSGGAIKTVRCEKCNTVVVSNRPGDPFVCKCGWKKSRP